VGDPYREALESRFDGPVTVMDLAEALYVQRGSLDGETVVIVATLAALRVTDTEGRKIYEPAGALEHHFTRLAPELLGTLERRENGTPVESLANVLRLRRPVVIMDEAHNARTQLSFETLARFSPSCVVEFTATPATRHAPEAGFIASNVLAHVSAAELKAEEMIKLPVKLWTHGAWTDAVTDALAKQRELEEIAAREQQATGERIRPIVLFQAQANRAGEETITPAALKQALIDDHQVPAEQIAIETGSIRELEGVDLSAPACPIRFVITVQALREGWDCPTAYVLCSIAEQASARAVEQLLGRVLRLPGARRKQEPALNLAYAFVVSPSFAAAAQGLKDALVEAGFERLETETLVEEGRSEHPSLFYATPAAPVQRVVSEPPRPDAFAALEPAVRDAVRFDPATMTVTVTAPLSEAAAERLAECFTTPEARAAVRTLSRESRQGPMGQGTTPTPAPRGLVIPQLAIRTDHGLELFEETHFLEAPWRLADLDAALSDAEFPLRTQGGQEGVVDVGAQGRIEISFHDAVSNQLTLLEGEPGWTTASLAVWLDAHIPHPDLTQSDVRLFVHRTIEALLARAGASVDQLAREKFRLRKALELKIESHRTAQHVRAFQQSLFGEGAAVEVVPEVSLSMGDPSRYSPNWLYEGAYRFRKHLFPQVGELKDTGEEQACAIFLDEHPLVATWVRNVSNRPQTSFWLQTSTDRFYPDFVGELTDGRVFAVEYKGADRWSDDDSREKRAVGDLWAAASGGWCVFVMPQGPDWGSIESAFSAAARTGAAT
jgi:type III restriction enzyme